MADDSIVTGAAANTNPSMTIAALAERGMTRIVSEAVVRSRLKR